MTDIKRSALMPFPASFLYEIVNKVEDYPGFLPWCGGVEIHHHDTTSMEASILMKKAGLNHWFRTRNSMVPGESIDMTLVEGPFQSLAGHWSFTPVNDSGCKIELEMHFEMKSGVTSAIIAPVFTRIANTMVDSFCTRARELYEK